MAKDNLSKILKERGFLILRAVAAIDSRLGSDRNPAHPDFILTTSSPCVCEPWVTFWLTDDIEDPEAELVIIEYAAEGQRPENHQRVEFDWDMGRYNGYVVFHDPPMTFARNLALTVQIVDIGSLS